MPLAPFTCPGLALLLIAFSDTPPGSQKSQRSSVVIWGHHNAAGGWRWAGGRYRFRYRIQDQYPLCDLPRGYPGCVIQTLRASGINACDKLPSSWVLGPGVKASWHALISHSNVQVQVPVPLQPQVPTNTHPRRQQVI